MNEVILEASSYKRKYKCPYCDYRNTREKLIYHVDEKHDDMIPEGYTASRVVFNYVNGKEKGTCVCGCGRETMWNENICRYERFTDDPKCKQRYIDLVNQRKMKKYGTWNLAADPKFQEKMLAGRSISGTYKYSDGGERSYVGSYERKLHEFLDVVCKFESKHILSPGPIIEYIYKGEKHHYISDIFIIPYNLIIEVKDGGDNPNTREMAEYREKQIAKEAQIVKDQEYNYVRVTNNQFDQLLTILAELKLQLVDNDYKKGEKIIRIYENAPLMVHYRSADGIREGLYVAMDNYLQFVVTESGEVLSGDAALKDCTYDLYASDKHLTKEDIKECFKSDSKIYETFSGNKLYDYDQIKYDDNLTKVDDAWKSLDKEVNEMCRYIMHGNIDTTLDSLESLLEDVMVETSYKSKIKDDFKPKGKKSLNDFKKVKIDKSFIEKYTPNTKLLKEADMSEFGYGWIDKDNDLVGYCMCNDYGWITAVEVSPKYMGYGLGEQLLKYSMSNMGGNRLGVHDDNQVAIRLYKNMGFKEVPAKAINGSGEKNMIFMTTDKSILNSLKGINEFHYGTIKELKYDTNIDMVDINEGGGNMFSKKITLVHGSNKKLNRIEAKSLNLGTRFSKMRSSSFWVKESDINFAITFGVIHALCDLKVDWYYHKVGKEVVKNGLWVDKSAEKTIKDYFDKNPVYLHYIDIDSSDTGRGQDVAIPEYTIDFTVQPDKCEALNYDKVKSVITYKSKEEIDNLSKSGIKIKTSFKGDRLRGLITLSDKQAEKRFEKFSKLANATGDQSEINEFHYGTIEEIKYDTIKSSNPKYKMYLKKFNIVKDTDEVARDYTGEIFVSKDDELIGHVFVGDKKDKGFITDLVVEKKYRKLGFGKKLLDAAINKYGGADLTVSKTNKIAIDMYRKRGFVIDTSRNAGKYMHYMVLESRLNEGFQSGKVFVSEAMQNKKKEKQYYHLSRVSMNDDRLEPKIPDNYLTQIGAEDNTTPRVCLSTSIDGCLRALSRNLEGEELWVQIADAYDKKKIKVPTTKEVPDAAITGEVWCLGGVDLMCIGRIKVGKAKDNPTSYEYKDENGNTQTAELYSWDWSWIAKNRCYVS